MQSAIDRRRAVAALHMKAPILRDRRSGALFSCDTAHLIVGELFNGHITVKFGNPEQDGYSAHVAVSGTFTRPVLVSQCFTGQAFDRPVSLPPPWIMTLGTKLLRQWAPSLHVDAGSKPHMLAPLLSVASRASCSRDEPPSLAAAPPPDDDDLALLLKPPLLPHSHKLRRKLFSRRSHIRNPGAAAAAAAAAAATFEPGIHYSFHFIVRKVDLATCRLIGLPPPFDIRLDSYLQGQPLRLLGAWCPSAPPAPPPAPPPPLSPPSPALSPTTPVANDVAGGEATSAATVPLWDVEIWSDRQWSARDCNAAQPPHRAAGTG